MHPGERREGERTTTGSGRERERKGLRKGGGQHTRRRNGPKFPRFGGNRSISFPLPLFITLFSTHIPEGKGRIAARKRGHCVFLLDPKRNPQKNLVRPLPLPSCTFVSKWARDCHLTVTSVRAPASPKKNVSLLLLYDNRPVVSFVCASKIYTLRPRRNGQTLYKKRGLAFFARNDNSSLS